MSRSKHHAKDGFRQKLTLLASQNAAYFAAVGFVILQVSLGIVMKASQNEKGQYGFSASGCVTISEFFKFGLSSLLFWVEVRRRRRSRSSLGEGAGIRGEDGFGALPTSERSSVELSDLSSEEEDLVAEDEKDDEEEEAGMLSISREEGERNVEGWFWGMWTREIGVEKRVGFAQLALLYALINNTIFVAYKLADPGTISLTRSGVTFITALVMICALGTRITKVQWTAIVLQVFGLIISQYHAKTGMSYPLTTYSVLLFQVFLSAVSGVYNQALLKSGNASLHASNMMLYLCGVVFNLAIHLCTRLLNASEPGFLVGYGKVGAVLVVVSNVFMGIAISAVFKYADAVIKCLATAVSTGILLYLSPILFGVPMNPLILPGAAVVLISSWLYMETAMSNEQQHQQQKEEVGWARSYSQTFIDELSTWVTGHRRLVLGFGAILTITIASFLGSAKASMPDLKPKTAPSSTDPSDSTLESPFKNTLAFIRIDNSSPPPLQTELVQNYAPFFHTLHISTPPNENSGTPETDTTGKENLTHDSWQDSDFVYKQVASTMQLLLNSPVYSEGWGVEGLFFLSSTSWIDPLDLSFTPLLQQNLLLPSPLTCTTTPPSSTSPEYLALQASYILSLTEFPYNIKEGEYCIGLNNFYYVPRRFFEEFIFLSKVFGGVGGKGGAEEAWAVSTIFRILDRSRRDVSFRSILTQVGGCWHGDEVYGDVVDEFTCGSGLRFEGGDVEGVQRQSRRLERQASVLGRGVNGLKVGNWTKEERGGNLRVYFESLGWDEVDQKEEVEELIEALGEIAIRNGTEYSL